MKLKHLKILLGQEYQQSDEDENYIGCFAPLYHLWGDLPRCAMPQNPRDYFDAAFFGLLKNFSLVCGDFCPQQEEIPAFSAVPFLAPITVYDVLIPFDVVVFRLALGVLHVGIYLGANEVLHVQRGSRVEKARLSRLSHRVVAVLRRENCHCEHGEAISISPVK